MVICLFREDDDDEDMRDEWIMTIKDPNNEYRNYMNGEKDRLDQVVSTCDVWSLSYMFNVFHLVCVVLWDLHIGMERFM